MHIEDQEVQNTAFIVVTIALIVGVAMCYYLN